MNYHLINNVLLALFVGACFFPLSLKAGNTEVPNVPVLPAPLTPPAPATPRINGPTVFGVRPGSPVLYSIPATGDRPMSFAADGLTSSLSLDSNTGRITGMLKEKGSYPLILRATNKWGSDERKFRIVAGNRIALTPAMGWSSWNCYAATINQYKILGIAQAMVSSGLSQHGWTYINIDDGWQGDRTGPGHSLVGNGNFPDMPGLVKTIHDLGLKSGVYSTPWETSYDGRPGGSAETVDGRWKKIGSKMGKISFAEADAREWAGWGVDYLKYDWLIDVAHTKEMSDALRATGRDIVFSLSNSGHLADASSYAELAESWRTTGDIYDVWVHGDQSWHYSVSEIAFSQDPWAPFAGPGHWNDPDMLVVGQVGVGNGGNGWTKTHPSRLTADQQYTHISMWCLLSAPLILGCDLEKLDPFTLGLLTNDEVLAIDQDELGKEAVRVGTDGAVDYYLKPLADGSHALGIFNRGNESVTAGLIKLSRMGVGGKLLARDLWRQQDIPDFDPNKTTFAVPANGVVLLKLSPKK
jgi:alpha-galactosidase